jgi:hypothetical protein
MIELGNYPLLDAVHAHGRLLRDLHLGFVEGVLDRLGVGLGRGADSVRRGRSVSARPDDAG